MEDLFKEDGCDNDCDPNTELHKFVICSYSISQRTPTYYELGTTRGIRTGENTVNCKTVELEPLHQKDIWRDLRSALTVSITSFLAVYCPLLMIWSCVPIPWLCLDPLLISFAHQHLANGPRHKSCRDG